jgi:phage-related protein
MNIDRLLIKGPGDADFVAFDTEYGMYLMWRTLSAPTVKTVYDEIPGMNGQLDSTEEFGEVLYQPREIELGCKHPSDDWYGDYEDICAKYHGRQVQIAFSNDPDWYWTGRLFVSEYSAKDHAISMTATVYPYKFKKTETVVESAGNETVTLTNGRMRVVPTVTIDGPVTLEWGEYEKNIASSTYPVTLRIAGFELSDGSEMDVTITGTANVTFKYREGTL